MLPLGGLTQEGWEGNQSLSSKETGPSVVVRVSLRPPNTRRLSGEHSRRGLSFEREGAGGRVSYFLVSFIKIKKKSNERTEEPPREPGFVIENLLRFFESSEGFWNRLGLGQGEKCVTCLGVSENLRFFDYCQKILEVIIYFCFLHFVCFVVCVFF